MVKDQKPSSATVWKQLIAVVVMFVVLKVLRLWLSETLAWGLAGFVFVVFLHLARPRSPLAMGKVLLLGATTALLLFAFTKFIG